MIAAILIIVAFAIGWFLNARITISVNVTNVPKIDTSVKPYRSHNPDTETFQQAQLRKYDKPEDLQ